MKKLILASLFLATPALAQAPTPSPEQRQIEIATTDLGSMHMQIIRLVSQLEAAQRDLAKAQAELHDMKAKGDDAAKAK